MYIESLLLLSPGMWGKLIHCIFFFSFMCDWIIPSQDDWHRWSMVDSLRVEHRHHCYAICQHRECTVAAAAYFVYRRQLRVLHRSYHRRPCCRRCHWRCRIQPLIVGRHFDLCRSLTPMLRIACEWSPENTWNYSRWCLASWNCSRAECTPAPGNLWFHAGTKRYRCWGESGWSSAHRMFSLMLCCHKMFVRKFPDVDCA